ncbi:hypothetical protein [Bacillus spizizenii]|uniref:hypothetical protein n=1 Tax=Bacillus spizizenii TaxID=96241 RepID=UPI002FC5B524
MFKERLIAAISGLIALSILIGIFVGFFSFVNWLSKFPIANAAFGVIFVLGVLLLAVSLIIEFINWLIVEPYRNHKRLETDAKRETEGPVE